MENIMTNGFCELNENEMIEVEGGAGILIGVVVGILIEGGTKAITGKSASDWVAEGGRWVIDKVAGAF